MTDTGAFTWQYALGAIGFTAAFISIPLFLAWINRRVDQRVNLHVHRALHPNVTVLHNQRKDIA